jgi:hypothetical protein
MVATHQRLRQKVQGAQQGAPDVDMPIEAAGDDAAGVISAKTLEDWQLDSHPALPEADDPVDRSRVASALSVHLAMISSDDMLVLTRRSSRLEIEPGRLNSAANGTPELSSGHSRHGDVDDDGFVDIVGAALRETNEEVGGHVGIAPQHVAIRALIVAREGDPGAPPRQIGPHIVLDARSNIPFEEIAKGFLRNASLEEGAFEVGEFVGLPLAAGPQKICSWLRGQARAGELTSGGLASALFALAPIYGGSEELARHWADTADDDMPSIERVINPHRM